MAAVATYFISNSTKYGLETDNVQNFIHRSDLKFDLVIVEEILHDAFLMFGQKFNAPVVTICMYRFTNMRILSSINDRCLLIKVLMV